MKNSELKSKIRQECVNLNEMIRQTSEAFEALIQNQGLAFELQYSQGTKYMCLVQKYDSKKICYGVLWMKYSISPQTDKAALQRVLERVETFRNKMPEAGTVYF